MPAVRLAVVAIGVLLVCSATWPEGVRAQPTYDLTSLAVDAAPVAAPASPTAAATPSPTSTVGSAPTTAAAVELDDHVGVRRHQPLPPPNPAPCQNLASAGGCYLVGAGLIGSAASLAFFRLTLGPASFPLVTGGAKNPDLNRRRDLVVFERAPGYTWVMSPDGTNLRPLSPTNGGGWMEPRFAPDGVHVLVTHDMGGIQEIFMLDTGGGPPAQLTNAPQYPWKWRPSLGPTGTRLILTYGTDSNRGSGPNSHVGMAPLPAPGALITDFTSLIDVRPGRPSYDGEYSPDGSSIIFDAGGQIWIAGSDGRGEHPVARGKLGRFDSLVPGQILFTSDLNGDGTHTPLLAAGVDGSNARIVADGNFAESFTAFTSS